MKNMFKLTTGLLTLVMCFSTVQAQEEEKKPISKKELEGKKLDIKDLEKKYWTPKDTTYNVVQNRTYGKEKRFAVTLQGGLLLNDTFNDGFAFNGALNYYFNETHGIELNYLSTSFEDSEATEVFQDQLSSGTSPDFNRLDNYIGLNYNFVPFYAKVSILGKKIIYFDFAFSPGIGMVSYERLTQKDQFNDKQSTVAFNLDITQHFFFSKNFAIRMDIRNFWFTEKILKFGGSQKVERGDRSNNTTLFNIGLQYFF